MSHGQSLGEGPLVLGLEPVHGVLLLQLVRGADAGAVRLAAGHAVPLAPEDDEEVKAVDTRGRVVLDAKVDVLVDAKAKVASGGEVLALELVLLDAEAALDEVHRRVAADGDVARDNLVTADAELAHGVAGLAPDGLLASQLLQHTRRERQAIASLADGDVKDELLDVDLPHHVNLLVARHVAG
eukprot:CAMPEP_0185577922 /NCGR_PEP_ID=MMETSP0434-20130131/11472_1 /TAXON_ID=626734 ORGANISM="Favella taraikaensis, Strain Fe Narragansett Bay" /NCGR_SAMPLE_ID=MMETSP0434 /ASSEMBLY_ACC=CAM_ASM_000379 /LENGTH=183 /DNA_ID=CAMNT_0028195617 /DNA_START=50 /DNA_END=598 /DNA_ORIENTATION=-